jgi:bifunctional non-homologous end joining protein LigD
MALSTYNQKRDFTKTPEPSGKKAKKTGVGYCMQKHSASHLHYDFRLELEGVLKSWAVPKGPSLDPVVKRLAVEVEDHPVDYGDFEGTIPEGEYGAGTVMLWDRGVWKPLSDPHAGIKKGRLEFELHGEKLKGNWLLIRTARKAAKPQWLLMKRTDDEAHAGTDDKILYDLPNSVLTGRSMEEIADGKKAKRLKAPKPSVKSSTKFVAGKDTLETSFEFIGQKTAKFPSFIKPELATLVDDAPEGDDWIHEIKFDGYRMQCHVQNGRVTIYSRNGNDWTSKLSELKAALKELPVKNAILDGELVSVNDEGTTDFQSLQNAFQEKRTQFLSIYLFDVLYLNGKSLLGCTLMDRKSALEALLRNVDRHGPLQYSKHIIGQGSEYAKKAEELGLEGIICKQADSPYRSARTNDWLKVKVVHKEEFVIGGFTAPEGSRVGLGALLVGFYDKENRLLYAGKVGTGFDEKTLKVLQKKLEKLNQESNPFDLKASNARPSPKATWVKPELVAQIRYGSITRDKVLRHAVFEGLREDKPANDVVLDKPMPVESAVKVRKKTTSHQQRTRTTTVRTICKTAKSSDKFEGIRLTSQDKVLYPNTGITKLDLAAYYHDMSEWILPHVKKRPLVLVRCPEGLGESCFYQKHPGSGTPKEIRLIPVQEKDEEDNYAVVDNIQGLTSLAQVGALELHAWGSTERNLERPDRLIFDLDPDPGVEWKLVVNGARQIRKLLGQLKLKSFVKTTGGKGLHVVVPIERRNSWEEAKLFSRLIAQFIESDEPDRYVVNMSKAARKGKIFIDYLRNDRGSTSVVPYSPRAREGAPVSTPLAWDELSVRIRSDKFNLENIRSRMSKLTSDPWKEIHSTRQSIGAALKQLQDVINQ